VLVVFCLGVPHNLSTFDIKCSRTRNKRTYRRVSITNYLLDVLRPGASSVGPVQQVLDRLAHQQSTADSGAAGLVTTSSSFPFILQFIRMQFISDPVSAAHTLAPLAVHLEAWTTEDEWEQGKRQLLLKELCISRRARDLPIWKGHIATRDTPHQRDLSLVPVCLERVNHFFIRSFQTHWHVHKDWHVQKDSVANYRSANVNLSEHIDLSTPRLMYLPEQLGDLTGLKELNLQGCQGLTGLPERLGDLTGLKKLYLESCCRLEGLPEQWGDLTGLKMLNLSRFEGLTGLPEQLGDLTRLTKLNLARSRGGNSLIALPGWLGGLTGLQELNLELCWGLTRLPERLGDLTGLKKLNLELCSRLTGLPDRLEDLTGLTKLNLKELCSKWMKGTGAHGKECCYQHSEMVSLLALVLVDEMDQKLRGGDMLDKLHWKR